MCVGTRTDSQKLGPIYTLRYHENKLYAGCGGNVAIWDLNVGGNVFTYKGERQVDKLTEVVVAIDNYLNDAIFYAETCGSVGALLPTDNFKDGGRYEDRKDVCHLLNDEGNNNNENHTRCRQQARNTSWDSKWQNQNVPAS